MTDPPTAVTRPLGPRAPRSRSTRAAFWVFVAVEVAAFILWTSWARTEWFWTDEWEFLAGRSAFSAHDLFRDHYTHWSTLPILVYRAMWWSFGLRSYLPYVGLLIVLHLAAAALLRVVMRRADVNPWIATAAASLFAFYGSGYHDIVWAFQIGFVGALVLGLTHLLLADHDGPVDWRDLAGMLAGIAALMTAGVGVVMAGVVALAVLIRRGWRAALLHGGTMAGVYLTWYASIGHEGYQDRNVTPGDLVDFVKVGVQQAFTNLGQSTLVSVALGALLVAGLLLTWARLDRPDVRRRAAAPAALAVGSAAFLIVSGVGRVGLLGPDFARASRYQHVVAALLLPAIAVAFDAIARRWRPFTLVACALLLFGIPGNVDALRDYTHAREKSMRRARHLILSIPRTDVAAEVPRGVRPDPNHPASRQVTVGWLRDAAASGRLPGAGTITAQDEARVRFRLALLQSDLDGVVESNCDTPGDPATLHLEKGDAITIDGIGSLRVATPPDSAAGSDAMFFEPDNGRLLTAVLGPLDIVIAPRNVYLPVTVCTASPQFAPR